ncbi:MBL fold metallo-hydrolase [Luteimicrobium sp. DT211]|uniref:MBL fold metallo-hydrolase n=1 Tax=Luteimicrobium sp. DT211 TaxID=3393412 RepID=UPI003CF75B73
MRLVKHAHACITFEEGDRALLVDPGAFTPDAAALLARASAVLVTHEHVDHLDADAVREALDGRDDLVLYGPAGVAALLAGTRAHREGRVRTLTGGEQLTLAGFDVRVVAGEHAPVHPQIPVPPTLGYVVEGSVFHPGDSHLVPPVPVDTLLVPVSGPWVAIGRAIDHVLAVRPRRTVAIHDVMLSEIGRGALPTFLGENGPTRTPMLVLEAGDSLDA